MDLILSKTKGEKITAETRHDGRLIGRVTATFTDDRHFTNAAEVLEVDKSQLLTTIDAFQRSTEKQAMVPIVGDEPDVAAFVVSVRGRFEGAGAAKHFTAVDTVASFRDALAAPCSAAEPLISWNDIKQLAAVDVDFHHVSYDRRPGQREAYQTVERVSPRPLFAWQTHGRGLRLLYGAKGIFTADEMAAAAALSVAGIEPMATVEIKADTRHPLYALQDGRACGPVREFVANDDVSALAAWMGRREVEPDQVQEWLDKRGLILGRRYAHDHCPIQAHEPAHREPVTVRENGIFCHACAGRGITYGHRTPGWFTYAALTGSTVPSQVRQCIEHLTHWEHARFVVAEAISLGEGVAKSAYAAALKLKHGDDPRIPGVFRQGSEFVRFERFWATLLGEAYTKDVAPILATLPACQFVTKNNKRSVDTERVARFQQPIDLARFGYPSLAPVWGVRIYSHRLPIRDPNKIPVVMQTKTLRSDCMVAFRPKYLRLAARPMSEEDAWAALEEPFPGLSRNVVRLFIAAKGVAEGEIGLPPLIFVSGPTSSAKTGTIQVAAAICGDGHHGVTWVNNVEKVRQAIQAGKEQGSFVSFDEIVKDSSQEGQNRAKALEFLLTLTPESLSHKLYVGPVHLGSLPVCVLTDTNLPVEIKQHAQLARRLIHVHMPQEVKWERSIPAANLGKIEHLRIADPRYATACDVILSGVIDDFFRVPMTLQDIAAELGFFRLNQSVEAEEKQDLLRRFFKWVCVAGEAVGKDVDRWKGRGWKVIERSQQTELAELWRQLCNPDFVTNEKVNETDWAAFLGVPGPVLCEVRAHGGTKVAVRFIRRRGRQDYDVNSELGVNLDSLELAARSEQSGDDRPGDAEHVEPENRRIESVPPSLYDAAAMFGGEEGD